MVDRLSHLVTRHATWIVAISLLLTIASIARLIDVSAVMDRDWSHALRLEIDPSMSSVLPDDDPARDYYDSIRDVFGNDETLLLAVHHPRSIFEPEVLAALQRTSEALESLDGIREVMSLAATDNIRSVDGNIVVAPLFEDAPSDLGGAERVRRELYANPVLARSLVSEDGRTTAIVGYIDDISELEVMSSAIDQQALEIARREFGPEVEIWLSGGAHIKAETQRILYRDLVTIMPSILVLLMLIAFVSFRTVFGVLVPLLTLGLAILWTLGLASLLFHELNLVTISAPAILLGIGFAYAVHILTSYYEVIGERASGVLREATHSSTEALRRIGLATFLTALTTGVGFLSIALSPIRAIREFGLLCAIGVACLLVTNWTLAPALLRLMPERLRRRNARSQSEGGRDFSDRLDRALQKLGQFDVEYRRGILGAGALLAFLSVVAMPWITISTDVLDNFPEELPIRQAITSINEQLGGADQIYVVLEGEVPNTFQEPDALRQIVQLQSWLETQPEVGGTSSIADYVKLLNRAFNDDEEAFYTIPDSQPLVSQLLLIGANDDLARLADSEFRIARIPVRVNVFDSGDVARFADRVEARLERFPPGIEGRLTGLSVLVARTNDEIAYGQVTSLVSAFVIIWLILSMLFTSPWTGFLAMIPNLIPVLIYFGALGWTGTSLNVVTGLVACLVLGIAVDDTLHFLTRFNAIAREQADSLAGVRQALMEVGRAVTYTSTALCAGFFVLTASTLQQQVEFGALATFTLAVAWLADVTFTPALASRMRVVTIWDLLSVDLGKDPCHSIGLFENLSTRQARIVALMGTLIDAPAGRMLFRTGERSEGLFVVISGSVRTWIDAGDRNLARGRHPSGDTVGEVGLFSGEHHLCAEVEKHARLLRLTRLSMEKLESRYPRIAAAVFHNASRLMASRLALHAKGQSLGEAFARRDTRREVLPLSGGELLIENVELQTSLASLGLHAETLRAIGMIPMVEVAWADGRLAPEERAAILEAADSLGLERGSESYALLSSWLAAAPDPEIFQAWRDFVETLIPRLSIEGQLRLKGHVVDRARAVARAAGGVVGLRRVSGREERVMIRLAAVFEESGSEAPRSRGEHAAARDRASESNGPRTEDQ